MLVEWNLLISINVVLYKGPQLGGPHCGLEITVCGGGGGGWNSKILCLFSTARGMLIFLSALLIRPVYQNLRFKGRLYYFIQLEGIRPPSEPTRSLWQVAI